MRASSILLVLGLAVVSLQCNLKPKEGAPCTSPKGTCLSKEDALFCVGLDVKKGTYQKLRCLGPGGCTSGVSVTCDTTKTDEGSACRQESMGGKSACSADGKRMLRCDDRKWALQARCDGPNGCSLDGANVHCDQSVASAGDACEHEGRGACTADRAMRLVCKDGKMEAQLACLGDAGCHAQRTQVVCDGPADLEGAPCAEEGASGCERDGKTHLTCKNGRMGAPTPCRGANGCKHLNDGIVCDRSIAEPGDPCTGFAIACSADGKAFLGCEGGAYEVRHACKSCDVVGGTMPNERYTLDCK